MSTTEVGDDSSLSKQRRIALALTRQSHGRITAVQTDNEGIKVKSIVPCMPRGDLLLSSPPATCIALDHTRWATHCGICAFHVSATTCLQCRMVSFCEAVQSMHSAQECQTLCRLASLLEEGVPPIDITCHLLTIRLFSAFLTSNNDEEMFQDLYASSLSDTDLANIKTIVAAICWKEEDTKSAPNLSDLQTRYSGILARVLGCGHAIVDPSLPLGSQVLGRAVFWHHSFYNHSCRPNAFLSCHRAKDHAFGVVAKVHLLRPIKENEDITLSYIPMSGLSRQERQGLLYESYGFSCQCEYCFSNSNMDLPNKDIDVDSIREVQFSCNSRLLAASSVTTNAGAVIDKEGKDEIENVLSLVRMTQRGIQNQKIPETHEVTLEADRLLAMGLSILGQYQEAMIHHKAWINKATTANIDVVTIATQKVAYDNDFKASSPGEHSLYWKEALDELTCALGKEHAWLECLRSENKLKRKDNEIIDAKRPKLK